MSLVALEAPIFRFLTAQPAVTAQIGARFYPDAAQPGAPLPYAVHEEVERVLLETMTGYVTTGLYSMHIDFYGATRRQAAAARRAAFDALIGLKGPLEGGVTIQGVYFDGAAVDEEPPEGGKETPARRAGLDLRFGYSEN